MLLLLDFALVITQFLFTYFQKEVFLFSIIYKAFKKWYCEKNKKNKYYNKTL